MFEPNSRYTRTEVAEFERSDGRKVAYLRRRFLPRGESLQSLVDVSVAQGDRLDLIAARTIGDAEQFWRICDANDAMDPFELTAQTGRMLKVPLPQVEEPR
jgi:hypothetical protein